MSPDTTFVLIALGIVGLWWWVRHQRHVRRYPNVGCRSCGGAGRITDTDWRGRIVSGPCPRCDGDSWSPRRGAR